MCFEGSPSFHNKLSRGEPCFFIIRYPRRSWIGIIPVYVNIPYDMKNETMGVNPINTGSATLRIPTINTSLDVFFPWQYRTTRIAYNNGGPVTNKP